MLDVAVFVPDDEFDGLKVDQAQPWIFRVHHGVIRVHKPDVNLAHGDGEEFTTATPTIVEGVVACVFSGGIDSNFSRVCLLDEAVDVQITPFTHDGFSIFV